MKTIRPLIAMALLALAAVAITACGAGGDTATAGCSETGSAGEAPAVAVLATPPGAKSAGTDGSLTAVVKGAAQLGAQVMVDPVGSGGGGVPRSIDTSLVAEGPNELMREADLTCKTKKVTDAVERIGGDPAKGRPDLVSALLALNDEVEAGSGKAPLVVILGGAESSTEVGTGKALDLSGRTVPASPALAINALARAGLNFDCRGWKVAIVGGRAAGANAEQERRLRGFWSLYFRHCGGALVAFSPVLESLPTGTEGVAGPDYRTIPIKIERSPHRVVATLSGTVLFETGSARLRPAAGASLRRLLSVVRGAHGSVAITGYTDSTGTATVNVPLSRARAKAVESWLVTRGGTDPGRIEARGMGERDPVADNGTATGRATNRRVVVTVERR